MVKCVGEGPIRSAFLQWSGPPSETVYQPPREQACSLGAWGDGQDIENGVLRDPGGVPPAPVLPHQAGADEQDRVAGHVVVPHRGMDVYVARASRDPLYPIPQLVSEVGTGDAVQRVPGASGAKAPLEIDVVDEPWFVHQPDRV